MLQRRSTFDKPSFKNNINFYIHLVIEKQTNYEYRQSSDF